jgi:hypothetical protein
MRLWPIVLDPIQCVFVHNHDLFPFVYFFSICFLKKEKKKKKKHKCVSRVIPSSQQVTMDTSQFDHQ